MHSNINWSLQNSPKRVTAAFLSILLLFTTSFVAAQQDSTRYLPELDNKQTRRFSFQRYFTRDKFDRTITFYLSRLKNESKGKLPVVVCVQGSGSQSVFLEVDTPDGKRVASGGPESVIARDFRDRVRVLVVEKPGIKFLEQPSRPGSSEEASEEFNREFSLPRWTQAVTAATLATLKLKEIDGSKLLVLGHSEGGQVACEVAAHLPDKITHVAVMAGGGPTQLHDLIQFARSGDMYNPNDSAEQRVAALMSDWQKVLNDPEAHDKFILGHSHLRWSSFLASSPIEAILKTNAKVFIAQGTADTNSLPASADILHAELIARGRDCTYERIEGANHGFMTKDDSAGRGWAETNGKAVNWFLNK